MIERRQSIAATAAIAATRTLPLRLCAVALLMTQAGCSVMTTAYERPAAPVPAGYPFAAPNPPPPPPPPPAPPVPPPPRGPAPGGRPARQAPPRARHGRQAEPVVWPGPGRDGLGDRLLWPHRAPEGSGPGPVSGQPGGAQRRATQPGSVRGQRLAEPVGG